MKSKKAKAEELHEEGVKVSDQGDEDRALELYRQALVLDPKRAVTFYNIGLIHKYRNEWEDSLANNLEAIKLAPKDEAATWNAAIAATALRKWEIARSLWNSLGLPIDPGDEEIQDDFGMAPVRLDPEGSGEVVWGPRIDPVRVRIENIPYIESGFRYHDIVLHDGAPLGQRVYNGKTYPVFNVLERFRASSHRTMTVESRSTEDHSQEIRDFCEKKGITFENWSSTIRILCRKCSEGTPHEKHDQKLANDANSLWRFAFAATDIQAFKLLKTFLKRMGYQFTPKDCHLSPAGDSE